MSWETWGQLMILILWLAIMTDMVTAGLQRRKSAAALALLRASRGEEARDGE